MIKNTHSEQVISNIITTSSNENIFYVTDPLWGESTGHRWIPRKKASDAEFGVFFDLRLDKRLRKQSRRQWFETPSRSLWRHCDVIRSQWVYVDWKKLQNNKMTIKPGSYCTNGFSILIKKIDGKLVLV